MERGNLSAAVEKQLECPVCLLKLRTPKVLECMHTFCQQCLIHVSKSSRLGGISIRCPTCRQKTKVLDITKLHNNYIVQGIIETMAIAERKLKWKSIDTTDVSGTVISRPDVDLKNQDVESYVGDIPNSSMETSDYIGNHAVPNSRNHGNAISWPTHIGFSSSLAIGTNSNTTSRQFVNISAPADRESSLNIDFNFTPSFNFGDLDKTSFARCGPRTSVNSATYSGGFDFSVSNSTPTFSFGSLDKASFSVPLVDAGNIFSNCNGQIFSSRNNTEKSSFSDPGCLSRTSNSPLSFSWGSLDKTSFA